MATLKPSFFLFFLNKTCIKFDVRRYPNSILECVPLTSGLPEPMMRTKAEPSPTREAVSSEVPALTTTFFRFCWHCRLLLPTLPLYKDSPFFFSWELATRGHKPPEQGVAMMATTLALAMTSKSEKFWEKLGSKYYNISSDTISNTLLSCWHMALNYLVPDNQGR